MDAGELTRSSRPAGRRCMTQQPACCPCRQAPASKLPSSLPLPSALPATGAVAYLKDVRNAISAARLVMEHTQHTILAGGAATQFAQQMGLPLQTLNTERSTQAWQQRCVAAGAWWARWSLLLHAARALA